jgi:hypothetical protein
MKHPFIALLISLGVSTASWASTHREAPNMQVVEADTPVVNSCEAKAAEKKLAGAAKASFIKKCNQDSIPNGTQASAGDALVSCEKQATEKKLAGAAKNSFVKKCSANPVK